jgi:hypothetical protein
VAWSGETWPFLAGEDMLDRGAHCDLRALARAVRRGIGLPLGFSGGDPDLDRPFQARVRGTASPPLITIGHL